MGRKATTEKATEKPVLKGQTIENKQKKQSIREKNKRLEEILERHFTVNSEAGNLLPPAIAKSTSEISGLLVRRYSSSDLPTEIDLIRERAQVKLSYIIDSDKNVRSVAFLTPFEREVYDLIVSNYIVGIKTFTTKMIYTALAGKLKQTGVKITPGMYDLIERSIEKCMTNRLTISYEITDADKGHFDSLLEAGESGRISVEQPLLNLAKGNFRVGQATATAYQFLTPPALMEYASARHYLTFLPRKLLEIPISITETNVSARSVLSQRILEGYSGGKASCVVAFSEMDPNYISLIKQKRQRLREITSSILDYWVDKKFIRSYELTTAFGHTISHVTIYLHKNFSPDDFLD